MVSLPPFRALTWPAKAYVVAVVGGSVLLVLVFWALFPVSESKFGTLVYLAVGTQIAALLPIRWRDGVQTVADPLLLATGLYAPGAGVGTVAWLALFDGRLPGRTLPWWAFIFNRAMHAFVHVIPSLIVMTIAPGALGTL